MSVIGWGGKVQVEATLGSGTFTDISNCENITPPPLEAGETMTTHLQSASATHTSQPGLIKPGESVVKWQFDKSQFNTFLGYFASRVTKNWRILFADAVTTPSRWDFSAWIKKVGETEFHEDDKVYVELTLQVTGLPVFTQGT